MSSSPILGAVAAGHQGKRAHGHHKDIWQMMKMILTMIKNVANLKNLGLGKKSKVTQPNILNNVFHIYFFI